MFRRITIEKKKTVGKRPKVKIVNLQQGKKKKKRPKDVQPH